MFVGRSPLPPEDLNTKPAYSLYILGYPAEDYAIIYHFHINNISYRNNIYPASCQCKVPFSIKFHLHPISISNFFMDFIPCIPPLHKLSYNSATLILSANSTLCNMTMSDLRRALILCSVSFSFLQSLSEILNPHTTSPM